MPHCRANRQHEATSCLSLAVALFLSGVPKRKVVYSFTSTTLFVLTFVSF
jgi:hypothetical protein